MTRGGVTIALLSALLPACTCERQPETTEPAPSASVAKVQRSAITLPARDPDGRAPARPVPPEAKAAGEKIAQGSPKACADQKCRFNECNKLCAAWVGENAASATRPGNRNELFFGCLGSCLDALVDGGAR